MSHFVDLAEGAKVISKENKKKDSSKRHFSSIRDQNIIGNTGGDKTSLSSNNQFDPNFQVEKQILKCESLKESFENIIVNTAEPRKIAVVITSMMVVMILRRMAVSRLERWLVYVYVYVYVYYLLN